MVKEADLHLRCSNYMRYQYPQIVFVSDFAAGLKLPIWLAKRQKSLRSGRAYPDIFIAEPKNGYHGMYLELKQAGTKIFKKDGSIRASKNNRLAEQHQMLNLLSNKGYYATFCPGYEYFLQYVTWYLGGAAMPMLPYGPQSEVVPQSGFAGQRKDDLPF